MNFNREKIKSQSSPISNRRHRLKTNFTKKITYSKKKNNTSISKIILYIILFFISISFFLGLILYTKYIKELPKIEELENLEIAESSVIYDKNGGVLYKIFKEKRTYLNFDEINRNMVNAIVAGEDKRYWENPGVDIIGLIRAGIYGILGKNEGFGGTSTLTQQLIRNTIIENRSSNESISDKIERKVKEIYLSYKLTNGVSKEKILELYLNKISYGHNAYGIEEAAKTFFSKSAKDLNILESSILASIPKGPTYYSPYNHQDRVVGYPYLYEKEDSENKTEILNKTDFEENKEGVEKIIDFIKNLKGNGLESTDKLVLCNIKKENFKINYSIDNEGCIVLKYSDLLTFLNNIRLETEQSFIEYQTGRKDFILGRMLEDGYINFEEYKTAIIDSIAIEFSKEKENIKAPHFVFYIKEYLEEKYGKEIISVGGLHIYTTLDPDLQEKAEELVTKQVKANKANFNAGNAALISIDNKSGDILAMVGSVDYFDSENKGNVNIITSPLQPGSSFKPFVYSLGIFNKELGSKTPIYDVPTKFPGNYSPKNFDGGFMGKMTISSALNHSRNITAIKMFYMAGGEANIVNFMKKLGVTSLKSDGSYGAPLALGTGEISPLELAGAYSVFANLGEKVEINPILRIVDSKGNIIEEKKEIKGEKVISEAQSYVINSILSDTSTRPSSWNAFVSMKSRPVAAKTGTSTKQYSKTEIFPANLWTIGYTPQITTVVWAGNTTGGKLGMRGDGLNGAGPIWRDFMEYAHKNKPVERWPMPKGVSEINISEITGLLPNPENALAQNLLVKSYFVNKPTKYDNSFITVEVDALCNGKVTENTPEAAIRNATLVEFHSLKPEDPAWENPVQEWAKGEDAKKKYGNISNLITSRSEQICERNSSSGNMIIRSNIKNNNNYFIGENYIEIAYQSDSNVKSIEILINGAITQTISTENKKEGLYIGNIFIPGMYRNQSVEIEIRAIDDNFYSSSEKNTINILNKDDIVPEINLENPITGNIKIYENDFFNLKANIFDNSKIGVVIFIDDIEYKNLGDNRKINISINGEKKLDIGSHNIKIVATDSAGNKSIKEVSLEIMKK
ncbi:MAG: transglycosylase domain-containing protein [Candidatus Gracilibacteria bacterium]|nr:transglycosylase domain-containing protein [Candidatus Gracilibacteria bacterium]